MEMNILGYEHNWHKRGMKEAIHIIRRIQPTLNEVKGRYHLSPLYNDLIRRNVGKKPLLRGTTTYNSNPNFNSFN